VESVGSDGKPDSPNRVCVEYVVTLAAAGALESKLSHSAPRRSVPGNEKQVQEIFTVSGRIAVADPRQSPAGTPKAVGSGQRETSAGENTSTNAPLLLLRKGS
jgi:hypothetical protein